MFGMSRDTAPRHGARSAAASRAAAGATTGVNAPDSHGWHRREEAIMGTAISVELWCEDAVVAESAMNAVMEEMHRIDRLMSPHKPDSELSRINRNAEHMAVPVCDEMMMLFKRASHFSTLSKGAFDITYASVGRLFDYRQRIRPGIEQLQQARLAVGYKNFLLDEYTQTVRFGKPGMCIDLGGFAKGHAVDNATEILARYGIGHANVSAGGDSRVMGDKRGRPWMIGVRDPRREDRIVALLPLVDTSISTSGDYERYFDEEGVRFHHLIDPLTGKSPDTVRSVTILASDGLTTEAFSKIVFVLGIEQGLKLVEAQHGIDAIIVDTAGVLHFSSGLLNSTPG